MRKAHKVEAQSHWSRHFDIAWALVGLLLTAGFSLALYFDMAGVGGFR